MQILCGGIWYEPDGIDVIETARRIEVAETSERERYWEWTKRFEVTRLDETIRDLCKAGA